MNGVRIVGELFSDAWSLMRVAVTLLTGVAVAGCTPCLGVAACSEVPRTAAVTGRLLHPDTRRPVANAGIDLIVVSGSTRDSVTVVTDAEGLFDARLPASGSKMSLRVRPLGAPGYLVDSLPCRSVQRDNDACVLEPLLELPTFPQFVFFYRATGAAAGGVRVRFVRTGGSPLIVLKDNVLPEYSVVTEATYGVGVVYPQNVYAGSLDPVVVDFVVELPPPYGTMTRPGYAVQASPWARNVVVFQPVGPSLLYTVAFRDSATQQPVAGVSTWLVRQSGVATVADSVSSFSGVDGLAYLDLRPLANGSVNSRLTVQARTGSPVHHFPMTLPTFDADTARRLPGWIVGATGIIYPQPPPD
jgi:hypothetical protein